MRIAIFISVVVAFLRMYLPAHGFNQDDLFKDAAHLWVGGLIGAAIVSKDKKFWILSAAISVVEVAAAILK